MLGTTRIEWTEDRRVRENHTVTYRMIAERKGEGWIFFEKEITDVRWFDTPATSRLLARVRLELRGRCREDEGPGGNLSAPHSQMKDVKTMESWSAFAC